MTKAATALDSFREREKNTNHESLSYRFRWEECFKLSWRGSMNDILQSLEILRFSAWTPEKLLKLGRQKDSPCPLPPVRWTSVSLDPGALPSGRGRGRGGALAQRGLVSVKIHTCNIRMRSKAWATALATSLLKKKKKNRSNMNQDKTLDEWLKVVCGHFELQAELPHIK